MSLFCGECGQPCGIEVVDLGIGVYDCGGHSEVDSRPCCVSDCCEADIYAEQCETCEGACVVLDPDTGHMVKCDDCNGTGLTGLMDEDELEDIARGD